MHDGNGFFGDDRRPFHPYEEKLQQAIQEVRRVEAVSDRGTIKGRIRAYVARSRLDSITAAYTKWNEENS